MKNLMTFTYGRSGVCFAYRSTEPPISGSQAENLNSSRRNRIRQRRNSQSRRGVALPRLVSPDRPNSRFIFSFSFYLFGVSPHFCSADGPSRVSWRKELGFSAKEPFSSLSASLLFRLSLLPHCRTLPALSTTASFGQRMIRASETSPDGMGRGPFQIPQKTPKTPKTPNTALHPCLRGYLGLLPSVCGLSDDPEVAKTPKN